MNKTTIENMDRKGLLKLARTKTHSLSQYETERLRLILLEWLATGVIS